MKLSISPNIALISLLSILWQPLQANDAITDEASSPAKSSVSETPKNPEVKSPSVDSKNSSDSDEDEDDDDDNFDDKDEDLTPAPKDKADSKSTDISRQSLSISPLLFTSIVSKTQWIYGDYQYSITPQWSVGPLLNYYGQAQTSWSMSSTSLGIRTNITVWEPHWIPSIKEGIFLSGSFSIGTYNYDESVTVTCTSRRKRNGSHAALGYLVGYRTLWNTGVFLDAGIGLISSKSLTKNQKEDNCEATSWEPILDNYDSIWPEINVGINL
jgi:hypothetical protein